MTRKKKTINESGIQPVECKVLVLPETLDKKTPGGIILPDDHKDRRDAAAVRGILIAAGDMAFDDWKGAFPEIGAKVLFSRYAGQTHKVEDVEYRLCNDTDIAAVLA